MNIILYSTGCPKCKVLKAKLDKKNVKYDICEDTDIMLNKNIANLPALEVNDEIYDFAKAVKWANEQE